MGRFETDLAWLGGFMDAEGSILSNNINGKDYYYVSVFNTNEEMMLKAKRIFEYFLDKPIKLTNIKKSKNGNLPGYVIRIADECSVLITCMLLKPYLFGKQKNCIDTINSIENRIYPLKESIIGRTDISEIDTAWLAGLIEGDGSLRIRERDKKFSFSISIYNTNTKIMENGRRIMSKITNREIKISKKTVKGANADIYTCDISRIEDVFSILLLILPYLSGKKEKALEIINQLNKRFSKLIKLYNGGKHGG